MTRRSMRRLRSWPGCRRERIAPQYILYSPSEVARFHDLRRSGVIPQRRPFALFVLGRYGDQTEAQPRDVLPYPCCPRRRLSLGACARSGRARAPAC